MIVPPRSPGPRALGVLLALLALLLAACDGAAPPPSVGATGADGSEDGTDGADGRDGASASSSTDGATRRDVQELEYRRPITALDVETAAGAITVIGDAPADTVRIIRTRSWRGVEPVVTDDWTRTTLTTRVSCDSCGVAFEVHVPPGVTTRLVASAGTVRVRGLTGDAELRSSSGGVEARDLSAATVTAESRSGHVDLDLATTPDRVSATTSAGTVTVTVPAGVVYRVDATTRAGRTEVSVPNDRSASRTISARSSAGNVTVRSR